MMARPDIEAIEMHHAWTAGAIAQPYETLAARPFLIRDPLIDAQRDRAALLDYIAELEGYIDRRIAAVPQIPGIHAHEVIDAAWGPPPHGRYARRVAVGIDAEGRVITNVSEPSDAAPPRDVDSETGNATEIPPSEPWYYDVR